MDPLSIGSGAAGFFGLGITICNGLIRYCSSYRSREDDIALLQANAERLRRHLEVLEGHQNGVGLPPVSPSLQISMNECIETSRVCLAGLNRLCDKYSPPATDLNQKSRSSFVRRVSFPLQKDKFDSFRRQVQHLHTTLSFQVGMMNYDAVRNLRQETLSESLNLSSIISTQSQDMQQQIAAIIPDLSKTLEFRLWKSEQSLQARMDALEIMIKESLCSDETDVHDSTCFIESSNTAPEIRQDRSKELVASSRTKRVSGSGKNSSITGPLWELRCHCAGSISPAYPVTHATSCHLSFRYKQRRALIGKIRLFNYFFQFQVAIEYSQYAFLRSLHVQHNFTIRATVPQGSPAFDLIDGITFNMGFYSTVQSLRKNLQSCLQRLQRMFMEGRAWPTDIEDGTGNNLLHAATSACWHLMADEMKETYSQFLQTLVEFGVPLKDSSCSNETPVTIVLKRLTRAEKSDVSGFTVVTGVVKSLLDLGVDVLDIMPLQTFGPSILPIIGHEVFEEQGTIDQEELPRALLEKWESRVRGILTGSDAKDHLLTRGKLGETPLHVASHWPRGMELILELGGDTVHGIIDAEDVNGATPLDYALKLNEPDCVRMLLENSAEMDLEIIQNIANCRWEASARQRPVTPVLTQALAKRRQKLLRLANDHIPERKTLDNMGVENEVLIQQEAFGLVRALMEEGVILPKEFRSVQPGSVYHCAVMNDETAESLFSSGFSQTTVEFLGFTPLMTIDLVRLSQRYESKIMYSQSALSLVDWFLRHGEDLSRPMPAAAAERGISSRRESSPGVCLVHQIASEMGRSMRYQTAFGSERHTPMLQQILTSPVLDCCDCLCTENGCSAASILAREVWALANGEPTPGEVAGFSRTTWRMVMDLLTSRLADHAGARKFASDFIRVSTFERLGMSHTCCRFMNNSGKYEDPEKGVTAAILVGEYKLVGIMDPEDVIEIQEEERYLEAMLEALAEEFEVNYEELGLSLSEFFFTYWWTRMDEVEVGTKMSQEEVEALRRIGVVFDA
ncbi:hypothetical protein KVR01_007356 [Diaporthe batatas]|uniref:uncharacterized protein n=1 Tax=Diaporthe batatas TaxID=748121 RepID=UPI001D04813F|nr:uncharacterized protein KVR01_007356 [Diaporthe batatas]KAG8162878.1 hypothetical protein KVR01_007356 [Diaporthe batatas]